MKGDPMRDDTTSGGAIAQAPQALLTFRAGGSAFALDILAVREIRTWAEPTPLPHAPGFMRGMVNLRGTVLPVIDLGQRLGHGATPDRDGNVVIVVHADGRLNGLLVEAVSDIVQPAAEDFRDAPERAHPGLGLATGLVLLGEEIVQMLDLALVIPDLDVAPEAPVA
jgi:purine-binding chemotaxis protein CheW